MAGSTSLLSLPNELLIIIFENPRFPVDYLCLLAVLCRRLHFLALPIYFARSGMPDPSKNVVVTLHDDGMDMLAALRMALFISSMEDITCVFPHPSCTSIFPLLPHVRRFRRFVSRFPSVSRVTLQLDARNSMCNAVGDDAALRAWSSTLGGLLNTLVEKRCTELTVRYGGYLTQSYTLSGGSLAPVRPTKRVRRALKAIKRLFRSRAAMAGKGWEFRRAPDQGRERALTSVSSTPSRSRKLTSLHIQSAVLVMPPCLNWTLSALRNCPITSLSLSQISLDKELWRAALSLIAKAAPNLTDLSLSELETISDVEILAFCARLPRLTSLKIGSNEEARGTPTKCANGPIPEFRALARLTAPADFILYCLRPRLCFPKLTSLCISFHGQTAIRTVGARLSAVCQAMAARTVSPSVSLSLALFSDTITFDLEAVPRLAEHFTKYLSAVASLNLHVFPYDTAAITRWIHLFPSVQHVALTVRSKPADVDADAQKFLRAISKAPSLIRTLTINGNMHKLDDDLPLYSAKA
ncbi:hypothetical protein FB451DRAFT_1251488 [Mycena latifolia]|nr:hypothetical protein FB451DRAFT_1251488 [Mycena latifolia]